MTKHIRATCHLAADTLAQCCPGAARVWEAAEPDALAYLEFPASHWKRLGTNNVQERANGEIERRSRVARVFPSEASPARLVGAVMCEQDEAWGESRCFSGQGTSEPCEDRPDPVAPSDERELRLMAEQAIRASLELADTMEAT